MSKAKQNTNIRISGHRKLLHPQPVKVIAVSAGKGGVGKSNVAVNLAVSLSKLGKKVMLLDADLGLANIDIMLGLPTKYNLSHVIQGKCQLSDIIFPGPSGINIIPAASGTEFMTKLSPRELAGLIDSFNELTNDLDYMIIDTAAGISETVLSFTRSSQELIVVVCDEPTSFADSYALIKIMNKRYEWTRFHILVNMVRDERDGQELFNNLLKVSGQFLEVQLDYLGAIPFDEHVHKAVKMQHPVVIAYPDSAAARSLRQLAEEVSDWPSSSLLDGNTSFFLERLVASEF